MNTQSCDWCHSWGHVTLTGSNVIRYTYDDLGRKLTETISIDEQDATTGASTQKIDATRTWTYNGFVSTYTDRNGYLSTSTYEPDIQFLSTAVSGTDPYGDAYSYSTSTNFHTDGSVKNVTDSTSLAGYSDSDSTLEFTFDVFGRISQTSQGYEFGATTYDDFTIDITEYFKTGHRKTVESKIDGSLVSTKTYIIDGLNRYTEVHEDLASSYSSNWLNGSEGTDKSALTSYNVDGTIEKLYRYLTLPDINGDFVIGDAKGVTESVYSSIGRHSTIEHKQSLGSLAIAEQTNVVNAQGQIKENSYTFHASDGTGVLDSKTNSYTYDEQGRLLTTENTIKDPTNFDEFGNRVGDGIVIGDSNRLLEDKAFSYIYDDEGRLIRKLTKDINGNPQTDSYTQYDWDHRGLLLSTSVVASNKIITKTEYAYDVNGRQIINRRIVYDNNEVIVSDTTSHYYHEGNSRSLELTSNNKIFRSYLTNPSDGQFLAVDYASTSNSNAAKTYWSFTDLEGSVASWGHFDGSAWDVGHVDFDSFGRVRNLLGASDTASLPVIWQGMIQNEGTDGLYKMNGGAFDPILQRYIVDTGGLNGYVFQGNNPHKEVGHISTERQVASEAMSYEDRTGLSSYDVLGQAVYGLFGDSLADVSDTQMRVGAVLGAGVLGVGLFFGGVGAIGAIGATGFTATTLGLGASALTTVSYASLAVSAAQVVFSGDGNGSGNLAMDGFGVAAQLLANRVSGLYKTALYGADIAVNAYQGFSGTAAAYTDFSEGNYVSGSFNAASGFLGFAGAGLGGRSLIKLFRSDPTTNPLNFRLTLDPYTSPNLGVPIGGIGAKYVGGVSQSRYQQYKALRAEGLSASDAYAVVARKFSTKTLNDGTIVTSLGKSAHLEAHLMDDGTLFIDSVGVSEGLRRQGISHKLFEHTLNHVRGSRVSSIQAYLTNTNREVTRMGIESGLTAQQAAAMSPLGKSSIKYGFKSIEYDSFTGIFTAK